MSYQEIKGDLVKFAKEGMFDVIAHGCNCYCTMGAGIAPQMADAFRADDYPLEDNMFRGDINKLGQIDYMWVDPETKDHSYTRSGWHNLAVVNCYTQFGYGRNHKDGSEKPIDYEALTLCMRKLNHEFIGLKVGLPKIGAGLAGGDWEKIKDIIIKELYHCNVTVVIYET